MNSYTLNLSTTNTSTIQFLNRINFDDISRLTLNLNSVNEKTLPIYLKINWGVGTSVLYDNDVSRLDSNSLNLLSYSPLFNKTYSFEYYPSKTALYRDLSAQLLIKYADGNYTWIVIPIRVKTSGYTDSVGDLTLINTNILPKEGNTAEHQLKTSVDGYLIELRGD